MHLFTEGRTKKNLKFTNILSLDLDVLFEKKAGCFVKIGNEDDMCAIVVMLEKERHSALLEVFPDFARQALKMKPLMI